VNDFGPASLRSVLRQTVDGGAEVRLIEVDVANAELQPIHSLPSAAVPRAISYQALDRDDSVEEERDLPGRTAEAVPGHNLAIFFYCSPVDGKWADPIGR